MKKTILFVLAFSFINIYAQTSYPTGCYMSFEELVNKKPSENCDVSIEERILSDIQFSGGNDFKLISEDKSIKKKILKKEIWAISDGKNLYINGIHHKFQHWYSKVLDEGKYLIFKGAIPKGEVAVISGLFGGVTGGISGAMISHLRYIYLLNIETGETFFVNETKIHQTLSNYDDLLSEYDKEEDKKSPDTIFKYVKILNNETSPKL